MPKRKNYCYIVKGDPIVLQRVVESNSPRFWDSYRQKRFNYKMSLENQHHDKPLFTGPLSLDVIFYMPIVPAYNYEKVHDKPHGNLPCIFSLFNFIDHILIGTIYKRDCQICSTKLTKEYSDNPRTEIKIRRL